MRLAWLVLSLLAAAPAAAAPVRLAPASGEAGARATIAAGDLPPNSRVELRVGRGAVRMLQADSNGRLRARLRVPGGDRRRVRVAVQSAAGERAVLHYRVGSRWSAVRTAAAADWRGRIARVEADLVGGRLETVVRVHGLEPGTRVGARYGGRRVRVAKAGRRGRGLLRATLPQDAIGRILRVGTPQGRLSVTLPTPPATVVATADIACEPPYETGPDRCRHAETAKLAERLRPDAVLLAGDIQYQEGTRSEFRRSFDPTWGQISSPLRPVPGNHEYRTPGALGYFDYFESQSGWRPPPWYGFEAGSWRVLALNSNCEEGRADCVEQERWLRANLRAEPHRCTLAFWHHPRYSSGFHGSDQRTTPFWRPLHEAGAEAVVSGHDHHYERFAPQDADGQRDESGLRQFVVGTGGSSPSTIRAPAPHSLRRQNAHFGVLVLKLYEDAYSWRFVALGGRTLDYGNASCV